MTSKPKLVHRWQFEAIGTSWSIETAKPLLDSVKKTIISYIASFDKAYSRFRDDSLVILASKQPGTYVFPPETAELIAFYRNLYIATDGAVSPLIGNILDMAGYDSDYSLRSAKTPKPVPAWDTVMRWKGSQLTTWEPILLDVGAAGKGFLVDVIATMLEDVGHVQYVVDASGDIRVCGIKQTVGLENPFDTSRVLGTVVLDGVSICASATNRRAWGDDWHHIVDPKTARPVIGVAASWVIAKTTCMADGLATALFFVGPDRLRQWDFAYMRIMADGTIERSDDFMGELYI